MPCLECCRRKFSRAVLMEEVENVDSTTLFSAALFSATLCTSDRAARAYLQIVVGHILTYCCFKPTIETSRSLPLPPLLPSTLVHSPTFFFDPATGRRELRGDCFTSFSRPDSHVAPKVQSTTSNLSTPIPTACGMTDGEQISVKYYASSTTPDLSS